MVRRSIALVGGVILLILLVVGVRGCLNARQEQAVEDYANRAAELMRESKLEGDALFDLLQSSGGTGEAVNIENTLNGYRVQSANRVERARDLDVPGDMSTAQRYLLEVLELRRDGLRQVADSLPQALGDQDRRVGTTRVTGAMQIFLASDTIDRLRFRPAFLEALQDASVSPPRLPDQGFVPDIEWLDPAFVANQVNALRSGTGGAAGEAAPGLHGNGIAAVSLGGTTLTPGASPSIQLSEDLAFEIQVQNQGENTENDVLVRVTVGEGNDAIEREETIDTIAPGEIKTVTIPLAEQPPTGQNVPITVEVEPVPGEEKTDNNTQELSVIFTR
ncbi:MAG: hypothetical protein QOH58_1899 [Thermoleophilaceae bacterium]|jgi:hypothetical protein|nr:hypothetical protein [Thermoleophilaceae bacterium]